MQCRTSRQNCKYGEGRLLSNYPGGVFEEVARQLLIKEIERIFSFSNVGKWWHKEREIDIVTTSNATDEILFIELTSVVNYL